MIVHTLESTVSSDIVCIMPASRSSFSRSVASSISCWMRLVARRCWTLRGSLARVFLLLIHRTWNIFHPSCTQLTKKSVFVACLSLPRKIAGEFKLVNTTTVILINCIYHPPPTGTMIPNAEFEITWKTTVTVYCSRCSSNWLDREGKLWKIKSKNNVYTIPFSFSLIAH
jgi:hypothetical protein